MIHRVFDPLHQNIRCLSSVALERSSKVPGPMGGGEVLANHRSRRKHTREPIANGKRL